MNKALPNIELLSKGTRTYADPWGPSWLAEPSVGGPKVAETPTILEPIQPVAPAVAPVQPVEGADACPRCGSTAFVDTPIHDGRSIRRDCATCGRTTGFPVWNSTP